MSQNQNQTTTADQNKGVYKNSQWKLNVESSMLPEARINAEGSASLQDQSAHSQPNVQVKITFKQ